MNRLIKSLICLILFSQCKPVDPALVHIPNTDTTPPTLSWLLEVEAMDGSGKPAMVSKSLNQKENNYTLRRSEKVHLYLISEDLESGITSSVLTGDFDYLCLNPEKSEQGLNSHGSIPGNQIHFDQLKVQAFKSWKLDGYRLLNNFECDQAYTYSRGKFQITGIAINSKKDTTSSSLTIQVIP